MKKVLVIVSGGIADYVADDGVNVAVFDCDNWKDADIDERQWMKESIKGFDDLTPDWINNLIENEDDDDDY